MKWITSLLFALLALPLAAQGPIVPNLPTRIVHFSGTPTGSCTGAQLAENDATGNYYGCLNGAWVFIGGGSAPPVTPTFLQTYFSCAVLDTAICTSATSSGNPSFLSAGSGATINVDGSTTPLIYFVAGAYQSVTSLLTVTPPTPAADVLFFVFAKQDTTNAHPVSADLVVTDIPPCFSYVSRLDASNPCQAPGVNNASASNPAIWFDLASNTTKICTATTQCGSAGTGPYTVTTPMIPLGVALITSAPAIRAVLAEPYGLNQYDRVTKFGFSSSSTGGVITGSTTCAQGISVLQRIAIDGGTFAEATASSNNIGCIAYSQTPVIITNTGSFGKAGSGLAGTAGTANANSTAGTQGGMGGAGASGGGGTANTSGAGGGQILPGRMNLTNNGGAAASAGNNGTAGSASILNALPPGSSTSSFFYSWRGASASGGAGEAGSTGGAGGAGGGVHVLFAPSILLDTGSTATSAGGAGANGTGTNSSGGGGGGGGLLILGGGFVINSGTVSIAGGAGGTGVGTGHTGGAGGNGVSQVIKLW
jgi:hypothetical protein